MGSNLNGRLNKTVKNLPGRGKRRHKATERSKSKACLGDRSSAWLEHKRGRGYRKSSIKRGWQSQGRPGFEGRVGHKKGFYLTHGEKLLGAFRRVVTRPQS